MKPISAPIKKDNINGGFVLHFKRPTARGIRAWSIVIGGFIIGIIAIVSYGQKVNNAVVKVPLLEARMDSLEEISVANFEYNEELSIAIINAVIPDTSQAKAVIETAKRMRDNRIKAIRSEHNED